MNNCWRCDSKICLCKIGKQCKACKGWELDKQLPEAPLPKLCLCKVVDCCWRCNLKFCRCLKMTFDPLSQNY